MKLVQKCPLCGSQQNFEAFKAFDFDTSEKPFHILECNKCGLAITSPMPGENEISCYYQRDYYSSGTQKFMWGIDSAIGYGKAFLARKILSYVPDDDGTLKVLDIGCGRASLLKKFRDLGCECHGLERDEFPGGDLEGIQMHRTSLQEMNYPSGTFDVIVIWHVLEHLHQPFDLLDEVQRVLKSGGLVAIAVPNFSSFQARLFRSKWFHLDLPRHLYHFGMSNLYQAVAERGLMVRYGSTCSLEQNVFGFVQSLLNSISIKSRSNELYKMLRNHCANRSLVRLMAWTMVAMLIAPLAMLEYVVTCISGSGASAIVFAQKSGRADGS